MIDDAKIKEWREACEKATPGPWLYFYKAKYNEDHVSVPSTDSAMRIALFDEGCPTGEGDATFIAMSRDTIPALLDEVERLRSEIQSMREDCPERYWKCESCEMYFDPCDEGQTTEDGVNLCDKCAVAAMTEARDGR